MVYYVNIQNVQSSHLLKHFGYMLMGENYLVLVFFRVHAKVPI
jgi:hypothetical protein